MSLSLDQAQAHPLWNRQLDLEERMRSMGIARFNEFVNNAREGGQETRITAVRRLMGHAHAKVVEAINALVEAAEAGKAGRKFEAYYKIKQVNDVDLLAHLTIRHVLDGVSQRDKLTGVALALSRAIEDEMNFRLIKEQNKGLFLKAGVRAKKSANERYKRNTLLRPAKKLGMELEEWSTKDHLLLGTKLIEMFVETTGLCQITRHSEGSSNTPIYLEGTTETREWIEKELKRTEWMTPMWLPTLIPPKPWSSPFEGGYWSGRVRRLTLVKTPNRVYLNELSEREMPEVYGGVNALQDTPWSVNRKVLAVMAELCSRPSTLGLIPEADEQPMPTKPHWLTPELTKEDMTEEQLNQFRDWKKAVALVHEANARSVSRRMSFTRMMWVAETLAPEEEFYFPYQLDWRGRAYPVGLFLHPQGDDAQRVRRDKQGENRASIWMRKP
jgi:DNA-directed RNA polymerase